MNEGICEHRGTCVKRCPNCLPKVEEQCNSCTGREDMPVLMHWFLVHQADGTLVYSNGGEAITGYSDDDLLGSNIYDITILDAAAPRTFASASNKSQAQAHIIHRSGNRTHVNYSSNLVFHQLSRAPVAAQVHAVFQEQVFFLAIPFN